MYPNDTGKPECDTSICGPSVPQCTQLAGRMDTAQMFERNLSLDDSGSIAEIPPRLCERPGALMLLPRGSHSPTGIRSIRMRSENRGRIKSLSSRSSRRPQLLSRFSHPGTHTPRTLKESLHRDDVLDIILSMLNAAALE